MTVFFMSRIMLTARHAESAGWGGAEGAGTAGSLPNWARALHLQFQASTARSTSGWFGCKQGAWRRDDGVRGSRFEARGSRFMVFAMRYGLYYAIITLAIEPCIQGLLPPRAMASGSPGWSVVEKTAQGPLTLEHSNSQ
jgi:hypothetical protein